LANGLSAFLRFMTDHLEADRDKFDFPPTPESPYTIAELHIPEIRHQVREMGKNQANTVLRIRSAYIPRSTRLFSQKLEVT
jgi:hypothetical protein